MDNKLKSERTRRLILETAFLNFVRDGFRATSLNDILADLALTKGALYHHFQNKMELGYAVLNEIIGDGVRTVFVAPLRNTQDPVGALKTIITTAKMDPEFINNGCPLNNLAVEMTTVDEGFRVSIEALYNLWIGAVADCLERGKDVGDIRNDVDTHAAATFIVASMAGFRSLAKNARSIDLLRTCNTELIRYIDNLQP